MSKKALGEGVKALFSTHEVEEITPNLEVISNNLEDKTEDSQVISSNIKPRSSEVITYNLEVIREVLADAKQNPRISLWSPRSAAVLRYLRKTRPEFSISEEARVLLEEAVMRKYPELSEQVEKLAEK